MARAKLSFSPLFIVLAFIAIYFGWLEQFFVYLVVLLMHEYAHYIVAKLYGYKLNKIIFMPYGAGLTGDGNVIKPQHEIVIALAGPVLNLVIVVVCICLWWIYPATYLRTDLFVLSNLVLGVFNFLPVFPLDGGRIVVALLSKSFNKAKIYKAMNIVAIVFSVLFFGLFIASAFYSLNLTFAFISFFLLTSISNNIKDVYYERSYIKNFSLNVDEQKPVDVKTYVVSSKMPVVKLLKYIKGNHFTTFIVYDNEKKQVVKTLTEIDVKKMLNL